jgi:dolichol-phosphate mannosyltransferase
VKPLVIIPTYNERDNIEHLIPAILSIDQRLHILIVDDQSPDDTAGSVLRLREQGYLPLDQQAWQGLLGDEK